MRELIKKHSRIVPKCREVLLTLALFAVFVLAAAIPDIVYYKCPGIWMSGHRLLGQLSAWSWRQGIRYKGLLEILKKNFGILVSAISVMITISVQSLNRSEGRTFGLKRREFDYSRRRTIYKYARRMVLLAPFGMIIAVVFNACILGYIVMLLSYLFIIMSYLWLESSFSPQDDWQCIFQKLCASVPDDIENYEDTVAYRMLLNRMRQENDREKEWEGANYLLDALVCQSENFSLVKRMVLCSFFYDTMYVRNGGLDCESAVYRLMAYVTKNDRQGWNEENYWIFWGMLHCLFEDGDSEYVFSFFQWYMDFPARYRKLLANAVGADRKNDLEGGADHFFRNAPTQTGILLIEFEGYLRRSMEKEEISSEIWEKLPLLWQEGSKIFTVQCVRFLKDYMELFRLYSLKADDLEKWVQNLQTDFQYGTARSLVVCCLKCKGEIMK